MKPEKEIRLLEILSLAVNVVLLLVGIGAVCVYRGQLKVMQGTLDEMKRSGADSTNQVWQAIGNINWMARNTQDAIAAGREQFKKDQRPYIWLTNTGTGSPEFFRNSDVKTKQPLSSGQVTWTFHTTNYGKTPAYKVRFWKYIKVGSMPFTLGRSTMPPPGLSPPVPPNHDVMDTIASEPGVEFSEFQRLLGFEMKPGDIYGGMSIRVRFSYEDGSGNPYETTFCLTRLNTGAIGFCREGNNIK